MTYYLTIILLLNGTFYQRDVQMNPTYQTYAACTAAGAATGVPNFEASTPWVEGKINQNMPLKTWSCGSP